MLTRTLLIFLCALLPLSGQEDEEIGRGELRQFLREYAPEAYELLKEFETEEEHEAVAEIFDLAYDLYYGFIEEEEELGEEFARLSLREQVFELIAEWLAGELREEPEDEELREELNEVAREWFLLQKRLIRFRIRHMEREIEELEEFGKEIEDDLEFLVEEFVHEMLEEDFDDEEQEDEDDEHDVEEEETAMGPSFTPGNEISEPIVPVAYNYEADILPALETYCFDCHDGDVAKGDLNLSQLLAVRPLVKNKLDWVNVMERVRLRDMPPPKKSQPDDVQYRKLLSWLDQEINQFDYGKVRNPGYEPTRRLSHAEYTNTIRDLFGNPSLNPAADFPRDLSGASGFKNSANTLFLQTVMLERYLGAATDLVEVALPDEPITPQERKTHQLIFSTAPVSDEASQEILHQFATRAFRKPVEESLRDDIAQIYQSSRAKGNGYEASIKEALTFILVSPHFLLRSESRGQGKEFPVSSPDLANRLSYFLWASMPDESLFRLAENGTIQNPVVLKNEVARMLGDPRSRTLGRIFAAEWLGFDGVGTRVRLDPIDNPWCTPSLMNAMREETALFVHSLIQENRPISDLIDARYTFLNHELAKHYRIDGISGDELQRVNLDTNRRGGIFGQASLLATTSFPGRTSPVVRGQWILDKVLGTPPPPPPPDVSELSEELEERENLTPREKLEVHRTKATCAGCHNKIDPLGFSLENYDHFGRYRTRNDGRLINTRAKLPDGTSFNGIEGLRAVIVQTRMEDLATQITRKMLAYALGRQLEYYDELAIQKIAKTLKENDYRFHTLIEGIVTSYPFLVKRIP
ncbi:MAG: DUF1592 domain-containing protein [Verrucomicrobiota bacterium]